MDKRRDDWPNLEPETATNKTGGAARPGGDAEPGGIARELQELGLQLVKTARTAWQSEQRQEIQQEVTEGLRSLRNQLDEAVGGLRSDPRAQTVKEQAGKVAEKTRVTEVVDDVRGGLALGLQELNDQLRRLTERLERGAESAAGERDAAGAPPAMASGGEARTAPATTPPTGERAGATVVRPDPAVTVVGEGLMGEGLLDEEPALAPDSSTTAAAPSGHKRPGHLPDTDARHDLPGEPEGPSRPPRQ